MNNINNNTSIHHIPMYIHPRTRVYERGGAILRFCGIPKPAPSSNSFDSPNNFCPVNGSHANDATRSPILASVARGCVASQQISSILRHEYDCASVRFCGIADRRVIGTSGPKTTEDARGNSRKARDSFFYKSELTGVIDE
jgi:hypothetical protein